MQHQFCFVLTNITITLLFLLILFLPNDNRWQPSISLDVMTISESLHISITFSSRSLSKTSFEIPDISTLFLLLYCTAFACNSSKVVIHFSRLELTFLTINSSLIIFSLVATTSFNLSISFSVWRHKYITCYQQQLYPLFSRFDLELHHTIIQISWYYFYPSLKFLKCPQKEDKIQFLH